MVEWSFDTRDARAARAARLDFVRYMNATFGEGAQTSCAELVLGELIGNVVRYAPGRTHVQAEFDDSGVTIAVSDWGNGFAQPSFDRDIAPLSESGRGLAIVSTLAAAVEVDCPPDDGCCVRARVNLRQA